MSKKKIIEVLGNADVKKVFFKDYDYIINKDDKKYHLKIIRVNSSSILTINSKIIWEIKYGKHSGVSFKTSSNTFINLKKFNLLENKIIVFKEKPYKLLRYVNESELVDISDSMKINNIIVFNNINDLKI
jgi:hypothetical protein